MADGYNQIKHIVVLMLENRSFDHLLGFLKTKNTEITGLTGDEAIPVDPGLALQGNVEMAPVIKTTGEDGYITDPDPGHEFHNVCVQLFSEETAPTPPTATDKGFVLNYLRTPDSKGVPVGAAVGKTIMKCFDPESQLPVLSTLAQEFVVCDHWFSSVPGPTWPNRFFVHAATSNGHVDSPTNLEAVRDVMGASTYGMRTIYENLSDAHLTWKIYYHDIPQSLALSNLHCWRENFVKVDAFFTDCSSGTLPNYSFIEPRYFNMLGLNANDQHPPHDVREGERLIADVYEAIRSSKGLWQKSIFVVLYDEAGGFYDHMHPPTATNPDGKKSESPPFGFDRLGIRVPAILISPYVPKGGVDHTVYDHTSLLATAKKLFNLPRFLTQRDATALTFEHNLSLSVPRDTVSNLTRPVGIGKEVPEPTVSNSPTRLSDYQKSLVALTTAVNLPPTHPQTEKDGAAHVQEHIENFLSADTPSTPAKSQPARLTRKKKK